MLYAMPVVRKMTKQLSKQFPGVTDEAINEAVKLAFGTIVDNQDSTEEELNELFRTQLAIAADEEYVWADAILNSELNRMRPDYDKAVSAGVDPVAILRVNFGLSESDAKATVEKFSTQQPVLPAQSENNDEDREESYA